MTLKEAKAVRDLIRTADVACTVPLGFGPDGYWAEIKTKKGVVTFFSEYEAKAYLKQREEAARRIPRPRTALDRMIDEACGVPPDFYE